MEKNLGMVNALCSSLTTMLGAHVEGRPNFITIAHVGIPNHGDPSTSLLG